MTTYRITVHDADGDVLMTFNRLQPLEQGDWVTLPDGTVRRVSTAAMKSTSHDPEPQIVAVVEIDGSQGA